MLFHKTKKTGLSTISTSGYFRRNLIGGPSNFFSFPWTDPNTNHITDIVKRDFYPFISVVLKSAMGKDATTCFLELHRI